MASLLIPSADSAQAPVGYDKNSYAYRDIQGTKFHESMGQEYGAPYAVDDVVGCWLHFGDSPVAPPERQHIIVKGVEHIVDDVSARLICSDRNACRAS